MRIGELANEAGVNIQTLRFYEREGLLAKPARTGAGYRTYTVRDLDRVKFIRSCRGLCGGGCVRRSFRSLARRRDGATFCIRVVGGRVECYRKHRNICPVCRRCERAGRVSRSHRGVAGGVRVGAPAVLLPERHSR